MTRAQSDRNANHKSTTSPKSVSILGATGTIGQNTLDLIARNSDRFRVVALTGNQNIDLLVSQAKQFKARYVATVDTEKYADLKAQLAGTTIACGAGPGAILEAASMKADICMAAIVGVAGLAPTLKAIEHIPIIALANKECLVSAGALFMDKIKQYGTTLIPVDSEHSAAYQCLKSETKDNISKLTLTASGGPFHCFSMEQMKTITKEQALKHPNWEMGAKITIDSATLMNKGLELIEAKYLFDLEPNQLDMVVHPQSIIHCLVSCKDGSVLAQMSEPDMRVPIAYALAWPDRIQTPIKPIDLATIGTLNFEKGDPNKFPCLRLANEALHKAQELAPVLNAANEIVVEAFLKDQISFSQIGQTIEKVMTNIAAEGEKINVLDLNDIMSLDHYARKLALELL